MELAEVRGPMKMINIVGRESIKKIKVS